MDLGLTQPEVAVRLGVTRESVDNWCTTPTRRRKHVRAIHDFLGFCPVGFDLSNMGARLVTWRKAAGITQRDCAARVGCDATTLRDLERGRTQFLPRRTCDAVEALLGQADVAP